MKNILYGCTNKTHTFFLSLFLTHTYENTAHAAPRHPSLSPLGHTHFGICHGKLLLSAHLAICHFQ